jgi:hypothetical protein
VILMWDKPKRKLSKEAWKDDYGFESGPTGGYQPNMSADDTARWKAKMVGTKTGFPQVEIRKAAGSLMTIVVNLGSGYNYKQYASLPTKINDPTSYGRDQTERDSHVFLGHTTTGINVHISMNGPVQMTFDDLADMQAAINEARDALEELEEVKGLRSTYAVTGKSGTDPEALTEALKAIPGVRHHFTLTHSRIIVLSCPESVVANLMNDGVKSVQEEEELREEHEKEHRRRWA